MQPIPETLEALGELDAYINEGTLLDQLQRTAVLAERLCPDLAGFSIALHEHGITLTMVATDDEIAALDGIQYLAGGPCVDAVEDGRGIVTSSEDLFSEPRWQVFAQTTAAVGVASTLTFPVMEGGKVVGTVNLYGRGARTFEGKHQALATVFGAWAPGAVTNADLAFSTRRTAARAPTQLREAAVVDTATGILARSYELPLDTARQRLDDSAARAGVPVHRLARIIVELYEDRG